MPPVPLHPNTSLILLPLCLGLLPPPPNSFSFFLSVLPLMIGRRDTRVEMITMFQGEVKPTSHFFLLPLTPPLSLSLSFSFLYPTVLPKCVKIVCLIVNFFSFIFKVTSWESGTIRLLFFPPAPPPPPPSPEQHKHVHTMTSNTCHVRIINLKCDQE